MKNIKKIMAVVIGCLIIMNCIPAYASINFDKATSSDVQEMMNKREEYADYANEMLLSNEIEKEIAPIDGDYIDLEQMIKVYCNVDLLNYDVITNNTMNEILKDKEYVYSLPVTIDTVTVLMELQIEPPLSEEEYENYDEERIAFYENRVGTWSVQKTTAYDGVEHRISDVEKVLKENGITDCDVYFIGALTRSVNLAAVVCTDNPDDTRFIVVNQMGNEEDMELDKETLYTLDEMQNFSAKENELLKDMLAQLDGEGPYFGGGLSDTSAHQPYNTKIIIIASVAGIVLLATVVSVVCVVNKRKKTRITES